MAFVTFAPQSDVWRFIAVPFRALGNFFVLLAESGPRSEALRRLNGMSDEELAARGTTRIAEIQRILRVSAYI